MNALHSSKASSYFAKPTLWAGIASALLVGCSGSISVTPNGCNTGDCESGGSSTLLGTSNSGGASSLATSSQGGTASTGGRSSTGGVSAQAGNNATGGLAATGGKSATGGASLAGGAAATCPGTHTNPLSQSLIDQFVTAHNNARSGPLNPTPSPALPPVSWDCILADSAYNYLAACPGGSVSLAPHNANRATDYQTLGGTGYVGENIYASTGSATPQAAVNNWMTEASSYDYSTNNIGVAGHYTQVVWRASVRIGCAIVNCPNYTYHNTILCDYAPGGNITTQKPY